MSIPTDVLAGRTEAQCMNALSEHGIISDNAVWWSDVGNVETAIAWLTAHPNER